MFCFLWDSLQLSSITIEESERNLSSTTFGAMDKSKKFKPAIR
jgi:hypothetical protein